MHKLLSTIGVPTVIIKHYHAEISDKIATAYLVYAHDSYEIAFNYYHYIHKTQTPFSRLQQQIQ